MTPPIEGLGEITRENVAKKLQGITEDERKIMLEELQKGDNAKTKSVESLEKLPELEDRNFRIDSTNWKEIISPNGIKVKENPEGDVREYLEGDYKGEQLFTGDEFDKNGNVIREGSATRETKKAGKKLPASRTTYRDIIEKKYKGNYQDFWEGEKIIFAGYRSPDNMLFLDIYKEFHLRCADGSYFYRYRDKCYHNTGFRDYGYSVRCLKD